MAAQNKRGMVDTRWRELQPAWGPKEHDGERQMLYDVLNDNESIESLVGCVWGPENVFRAGANRLDRMRQYDGIAVLTGRRVVLLKKKGMNKLITEMPLHNMESVDVDATDEVTLTGRSYSAWVGHGDPQAFTMRDVQDGYARNFSERLREVKAAPPPSATPAWSSAPPSAVLPTAGHAGMTKSDRINAQWQERSTMWSRNDPSVPERLMAGLLNFFTGENLTTYPGELRILHEVLEDDEMYVVKTSRTEREALKRAAYDTVRLRPCSDLPSSDPLDSFASPPVLSPVWRLVFRGTCLPA